MDQLADTSGAITARAFLTVVASFEPLLRRWQRRVELSEEDKRALIGLPWVRREFGREAYIAREGEPTNVCTVLMQGFAFRQKLVSDGARQIISFHIPGEFLDIQNCMLEVADHNVQALSRCNVAVVPKDALIQLMNDRPNVRRAIWLDSLIDSSVFREWVVNVGRRDARTRIAHLLCELAGRLKASGVSDGSSHDFPLTQEQIADATGLTAVHTNRTLQALRKQGLISLSHSQLNILDWDALAEVGDFSERYLHHSM
jgi:CRP-like cAMP-binding protein